MCRLQKYIFFLKLQRKKVIFFEQKRKKLIFCVEKHIYNIKINNISPSYSLLLFLKAINQILSTATDTYIMVYRLCRLQFSNQMDE